MQTRDSTNLVGERALSPTNMEAALASFQTSKFLVAKVTSMNRKYSRKELILFSWRTDNAYIVLALGEMEEKEIAEFVRKVRDEIKDRRILVWDPPHFHEATVPHAIPFSGVVDVTAVAKEVKFDAKSWETISQKLTGGPMCLRGAFLPGSACPSEVALNHDNIRVSMIYEFYRRFSRAVNDADPVLPSVRYLERSRDSK